MTEHTAIQVERPPDKGLLVGIDIGTSSLKVVVTSVEGWVVAHATGRYTDRQEVAQIDEQDPESWWRALIEAFGKLHRDEVLADRTVLGVAVTGQMHGVVFLDDRDRPVRPCITWADSRGQEACDWISSQIDDSRIISIAGSVPSVSFSATKLIWVRTHEPHAFDRTRHILLPKDYVRLRLTGERATDVSDASGTLLFDLARRSWSDELLESFQIDRSLLPAAVESIERAGLLLPRAAAELGLPAGIPVIAGGGDAACAAFGTGAGARTTGPIGAISIGTAGQVIVPTDRPVIDAVGRIHSLCYVLPGSWYVMGATLSASACLDWLSRVLSGESPDALLTAADGIGPGAAGLLFLPYLVGERTPHMDPLARGAFVGLRSEHEKPHLARAIVEGVAYALREGVDVMQELGVRPTALRLTGAASRSATWSDILASVLNHPIELGPTAHGSAYGACLLAGLGIGAFSSANDVASLIESGSRAVAVPRRDHVDQYERTYGLYRSLYPALREVFRGLSGDPSPL